VNLTANNSQDVGCRMWDVEAANNSQDVGCGMWDVEAANNSQNIYVCRFSSFQVDSHDINRRCEERSDEAIQKTANGHGIHRKTFHRHPAT
jgi:hypothetical protein